MTNVLFILFSKHQYDDQIEVEVGGGGVMEQRIRQIRKEEEKGK
jgi:hypothetical protein